jgi:DNA-binding response OmpR family regulator
MGSSPHRGLPFFRSSRASEGPAQLDGRVLVVEDDPSLRAMVVTHLTKLGLHVTSVEDGESALAHVAAHPTDLVCLDLSLPTMTGFRVCEAIRKNDVTRGIAVLILSARSTLQDHAFALEVGADGFVEKPYKLPDLESEVRRLLARGNPTQP